MSRSGANPMRTSLMFSSLFTAASFTLALVTPGLLHPTDTLFPCVPAMRTKDSYRLSLVTALVINTAQRPQSRLRHRWQLPGACG